MGTYIKLLHIATESFSVFKFGAPLLKYLRTYGYDTFIACSDKDFPDAKSFVKELKEDSFTIYPVNIKRRISPIYDLFALGKLYLYIKKEQFDIIHTQCSKGGFIGRIAAKLAGVPVVVHTAHDFAFYNEKRFFKKILYLYLEKIASFFCDAIFFVSQSELNIAKKYKIGNLEKLIYIGEGININEFNLKRINPDNQKRIRKKYNIKPDIPVVGAIARLVERKGIDCFLKTASLVLKSFPNVQFLVVGGGPLFEELLNMAKMLNIYDKVIFTNFVKPQTDIPILLSIMDIFFLPTRREGFGVVYVEAMAMEKPVVGSNIEPVKSIVENGVTGILCPVDQPELFVKALIEVLNDEKKRRKMGIEGRKRVETLFDEKISFERVRQEIEKIHIKN